jgi:hypothetical protein
VRVLPGSANERRKSLVEQKQEQGGYGSKWKKWLLIYAVAGAIVYLVIYLVFLRDSGYGGGGGSGGGGGGGGGRGGYFLLALPVISAARESIRARLPRR